MKSTIFYALPCILTLPI